MEVQPIRFDQMYNRLYMFNSSPPSAAYMCHWIGSTFSSDNGLLPIRHQAIM